MGFLDQLKQLLGRGRRGAEGRGVRARVADALEPSPDQLAAGVDSAAAQPGVPPGRGGTPEQKPAAPDS